MDLAALRHAAALGIRSRALELALLTSPAFAIVTGAVIARSAGPEGRGAVVVLATWGQVIGLTFGFSADKALLHFGRGAGAQQLPQVVGAFAALLLGLSPLVVAVGGLVGAIILDGPLFLVLLASVALGTVAADAMSAMALVRDDWRSYTWLRVAQPSLYLGGAVGVALWAQMMGADSAPMFGLALVGSIAGPTLLWGKRLLIPAARTKRSVVRVLAGYAVRYHPGSVLQLVNSRIDLLILPFLFGLSSVGIYAVAVSAGQLIALLGSASLMRALTGSVRLIDPKGFAFAASLALVVCLSAPAAVPMVFGASFEPAVRPAQVLAASGLCVYVLQGACGALAARGFPLRSATAQAVGTLSSVVGFSLLADTLVQVALVNLFSAALAMTTAGVLLHHGQRSNRKTEGGL